VPFFDEGGRGELVIGGLGTDDFSGVQPPFIYATLDAFYCAAFSPKRTACVNVAFSHGRACCWSALIVITPLGPGIFNVA
jgi:hypothetical protein